MSSTNRGSKRHESDFYITPSDCIHNFLNHHDLKLKYGKFDINTKKTVLSVLEPFAGNGAICKTIKEKYQNTFIWANELRQEEEFNLWGCANDVTINNFLDITKLDNVDVIISNPPFSIAKEMLEHCFKLAKNFTPVIMLLRLSFLESKNRYEFWQKYPVNEIYVLSKRPSFTFDGKTDSTSYAWYVWNWSDKQKIFII